ncbi:MAG: TatD family hydrolase [Opitutaceae bacterium]|nr:TatD family hydrolase [Cytophagales bacterium]
MMLDFHTHDLKPNSVFNLIIGKDQVPESGYFTAGIHPWFFENIEQQFAELKQISQHKKCIAIGECGLDKLKGADIKIQIEVFKNHLQLAETMSKPLIIHCVKAHNDLLEIKKKSGSTMPWVVHGFNQNPTIALRLIDHGFYFSLGKSLLHTESNSCKVLNQIPPERLFLETDSADVTIEEVYKAASERLQLPLQQLVANLQDNFRILFKIND